jgi:hypothetical protein
MLYTHDEHHPYATQSIAYQELAKLAKEIERELAETNRLVAEMEQGFIIESRTHEF